MTFDEAMRSLGHHAEEARREAVSKLARGTVKHEDDLTGVVLRLNGALARCGRLDLAAGVLCRWRY
jgi:hypothetical protein